MNLEWDFLDIQKEFCFRKARVSEARDIQALLQFYAEKELLLPRSLDDIFAHVRDFSVVLDSEKRVIGVCALTFFTEQYSEIRSLAVDPSYQGKRLGLGLIEFVLKESREYEIPNVFTLTYIPKFFEKQGFRRLDKKELPHKIWRDCLSCRYFYDCNEEALVYSHET